MQKYFYMNIKTPIGPLMLVSHGKALTGLYSEKGLFKAPRGAVKDDKNPVLQKAAKELHEYFKGARKRFTVPLAPVGTTFQLRVWKALSTIPYGKTWSYKDLAKAIGKPQASRAVGHANGKNPLCIIIPCHRVIAADGGLGGYTGGLGLKAHLLNLESQR